MSASTSTASTAPPHRVRLSVPAADTSTMEWLKRQDNISQSLRALVRDYIERNGYTDPTSRPVRQLPRRGRPPLHDDGQELDPQDQSEQYEADIEQGYAEAEQPAQPASRSKAAPAKQAELRKQPVAAPAAQAAPAVAAPAAQPVHDPGSTPGASGVGSFLSASRDDD